MTPPTDQPGVLDYAAPPRRGWKWGVLTVLGWVVVLVGGAGVAVYGYVLVGWALWPPQGLPPAAIVMLQEVYVALVRDLAGSLVILLAGVTLLWWRKRLR